LLKVYNIYSPPLSVLSNISRIGFRLGSFSNNLTTGRQIPVDHMDKQERQSLRKYPYFDGTYCSFWSIIMRVYRQSVGYDVWESIKNVYETPTNSLFDIGAKMLSDNNSKSMNAILEGLSKS
jgi:hypothetical protein